MNRHVVLNWINVFQYINDIHLFAVPIRVKDIVERDVVLGAMASDFAAERPTLKFLVDGTAD